MKLFRPWTWKPASLFRSWGGVIGAVSSKGRIRSSVAIPGCCLPRVHNHTPTCHLVIPRVLSERFELMHIGDQLAMRDDLPAGYEHYHQYKLYWKVLVDSSSYLLISLKRGLDYSNGHIKNKEGKFVAICNFAVLFHWVIRALVKQITSDTIWAFGWAILLLSYFCQPRAPVGDNVL
jgi:hypothetical protein